MVMTPNQLERQKTACSCTSGFGLLNMCRFLTEDIHTTTFEKKDVIDMFMRGKLCYSEKLNAQASSCISYDSAQTIHFFFLRLCSPELFPSQSCT